MNFRGWIKYVLPSIFVLLAIMMLWRRHANKGRPLEAYKITAPPNRNAVEQLLTLQEAISQVEALIQSGNIILLKVRALLFAALPQVFILLHSVDFSKHAGIHLKSKFIKNES